MFERQVEGLIQAAMKAGKFEGLRGRGRPADLRWYFETPVEVRLAHATLRGAGFVPREVELLNEIADLRAAGGSEGATPETLRHLELELGLLLERNKRKRGSR